VDPDLDTTTSNHSARRAPALPLLDFRRRQQSMKWSQKLRQESEGVPELPKVSYPPGVRRVGSFSKVEQYLQDQQSRDKDAIPALVGFHPRSVDVSQRSESSAMDDDDDFSKTPSFHGESGMPSSHGQRFSPQASKQPNTAVTKALDKTYLKNLASQHRIASLSSNMMPHMSSHHSASSTATFFNDSGSAQNPQMSSAITGRTRANPTSSPAVCRGSRPWRSVSAPTSSSFSTIVEVWPGFSAPLRGSNESLMAVAHDYYTPLVCIGCTSRIHCIADAQFIICPICRFISPVDQDTFRGEPLTVDMRWGIGLGFTQETLWYMQAEIAATNSF
jgi:hypothetical protein